MFPLVHPFPSRPIVVGHGSALSLSCSLSFSFSFSSSFLLAAALPCAFATHFYPPPAQPARLPNPVMLHVNTPQQREHAHIAWTSVCTFHKRSDACRPLTYTRNCSLRKNTSTHTSTLQISSYRSGHPRLYICTPTNLERRHGGHTESRSSNGLSQEHSKKTPRAPSSLEHIFLFRLFTDLQA